MNSKGKMVFFFLLMAGMIRNAGCNTEKLVYSLANVTGIEVQNPESETPTVQVKVEGTLPNPCYFIAEDRTEVNREEEVFRVKVFQGVDEDRVCIQVLQDFWILVSLDLEGLPAGTYAVWVNGVQAAFELRAENQVED